jgi:bifunctional DNase/RNase
MGAGPRTTFVMLVLVACAAGALCRALSPQVDPPPIEMTAQEVVRVRGGPPLAVLVETHGARRLAIPVTVAQAAVIEAALHGSRGLGAAAIDALGGRVLRASIDDASSARDFLAHLALATGLQELRVAATAGEALCIALQAGASIVADPAILEVAGVTPEDLRGKSARDVRAASAPAPVLGI